MSRHIYFAATSVAQDRYRKAIKAAEGNRRDSNILRSGVAGAGLGVLLRKPGMTRGRGAAIGASAGVAAQAALRTISATQKDSYGDRPAAAKTIEKLPWQAGTVAAGALGVRRLRKKIGAVRAGVANAAKGARSFVGLQAAPKRTVYFGVKNWVRANKEAIGGGAALATGIAGADALTSGILPEKGKTRAEAARTGLARGAIYGTGLAIAEPALIHGLKKVWKYSARAPLIRFSLGGHSRQLRRENGQTADPVKAATGETPAGYFEPGNRNSDGSPGRKVFTPERVPLSHHQVVGATWRQAKSIHGHASRGFGLLRDAPGALKGEKSKDGRRNEWHKAWVGKAAGSAAVAGGLMWHNHKLANDSAYRARHIARRDEFKGVVNSVSENTFHGVKAAEAGADGVRPWKKYVKAAPGRVWRAAKSLFSAHLLRTVQFEDDKTRKRIVAGTLAAGGIAGIGILTHRGVKGIGSLQKRGAAAIRRVHRTAGETVKDTIKARVNPAVTEVHRAASNAANATAIYSDAGKLWRSAKGGLYNVMHPVNTLRETKAAYREGRHGIPAPAPRKRPAWTMGVRENVAPIRFDYTAPQWDVRDQRGRSARVFAPGASARTRREKKWHERVDNIRRAGLIGAGVALAGGAALGYKLGKLKKAAPFISKPGARRGANEVPFPKKA